MDLAQLEKLKTIFYILFWGFSILALLSNAFVSGYIKPKIDEKKAAIEASRIGRDSRKISQLQAHLGEARTANQFFAELDNKINELFVMIRLNEDLNFTSEIYENFEIVLEFTQSNFKVRFVPIKSEKMKAEGFFFIKTEISSSEDNFREPKTVSDSHIPKGSSEVIFSVYPLLIREFGIDKVRDVYNESVKVYSSEELSLYIDRVGINCNFWVLGNLGSDALYWQKSSYKTPSNRDLMILSLKQDPFKRSSIPLSNLAKSPDRYEVVRKPPKSIESVELATKNLQVGILESEGSLVIDFEHSARRRGVTHIQFTPMADVEGNKVFEFTIRDRDQFVISIHSGAFSGSEMFANLKDLVPLDSELFKVIITWDSSAMKLYLNGILADTVEGI